MNEWHLATLVSQYQINIHPWFSQDLAFYQQLPTIDASIEYAALAKLPNGRRHPHQHRLKQDVLDRVRQRLQANKHHLEQSASFEDVIQLVRFCAVPGFGELAVYDTALRLAVRLSKLPTVVYLHRGTRAGAAALGLRVDRATISMEELPIPLHRLEPHDAENFLCIYKDRLAALLQADEPAPGGCTVQHSDPIRIEELQPSAPRPCSPVSNLKDLVIRQA